MVSSLLRVLWFVGSTGMCVWRRVSASARWKLAVQTSGSSGWRVRSPASWTCLMNWQPSALRLDLSTRNSFLIYVPTKHLSLNERWPWVVNKIKFIMWFKFKILTQNLVSLNAFKTTQNFYISRREREFVMFMFKFKENFPWTKPKSIAVIVFKM